MKFREWNGSTMKDMIKFRARSFVLLKYLETIE